ncbi:MAG: 5'/3'-nucleotidase SurE [Pseudomonadota bacterium]
MTYPRRILITNDDGIRAPGLAVLERVAHQLSDDVWVVAPQSDQSGRGHAITLNHPLRLNKVGDKHYSVEGTPTDCVTIALETLLKDNPPDIVLSGVNQGENLGEHITQSGTIAAAMEATLHGIKAIAFSQATQEASKVEWGTAEKFAPRLIYELYKGKWLENLLYNVNFPRRTTDQVEGIRVVPHGKRAKKSNMVECIDPRGKPYYWLGVLHEEENPSINSDLWAVQNGYISVTPLHMNLSHQETVERLTKTLTYDFIEKDLEMEREQPIAV